MENDKEYIEFFFKAGDLLRPIGKIGTQSRSVNLIDKAVILSFIADKESHFLLLQDVSGAKLNGLDFCSFEQETCKIVLNDMLLEVPSDILLCCEVIQSTT